MKASAEKGKMLIEWLVENAGKFIKDLHNFREAQERKDIDLGLSY